MKVLVCGGRDFTNVKLMDEVLNGLLARFGHELSIIHGAAKGADRMAGHWAVTNGVGVVAFPADWAAYGRAAGPVRNGEMLSRGKPDLVVAFSGGAGTANMVEQALGAGVRVVRVAG